MHVQTLSQISFLLRPENPISLLRKKNVIFLYTRAQEVCSCPPLRRCRRRCFWKLKPGSEIYLLMPMTLHTCDTFCLFGSLRAITITGQDPDVLAASCRTSHPPSSVSCEAVLHLEETKRDNSPCLSFPHQPSETAWFSACAQSSCTVSRVNPTFHALKGAVLYDLLVDPCACALTDPEELGSPPWKSW